MVITKYFESVSFQILSFLWDDCEIKPITILLGKNGAGKSCLLQPLLLLAQTIKYADKSTPLMLRGDYAKAGTYREIIHNHIKENNIILEFESEVKKSDDIFLFMLDDEKENRLFKIIIEFSNKDNLPIMNSVAIFDDKKDYIKFCLCKTGAFKLITSSKYKISKRSKFGKQINKAVESLDPTHFYFSQDDFLSKAFPLLSKNNKGLRDIESFIYILGVMSGMIKRIMSTIKYLGPVREYPKRFYEYDGGDHPNVGSRGEFTYSVLYNLCKNKKQKGKLDAWLKAFNLVSEVNCKHIQSHPDLLEIKVKNLDSKLEVNFSDTCFGVSQVLPLLVQSLTAKEDDIIITEQPEIHLNPQCEVTLADFFVETVKENKNKFVIETHSEHYLMRLRTYIKTGKISHDDVAIYFSEMVNGEPNVRKIELDENGDFPNKDWPHDFFKEALSESMMYATAHKEV